jgi:hypothetical protein
MIIMMIPARKSLLVATSILWLLLIVSSSSALETMKSGSSSSSAVLVQGSNSSSSANTTTTNNNNTNHRMDNDSTRSTINIGRKLTMERCLDDKMLAERSQIGVECMCKNKTDQGIVLICADQCAFCNENQTVCGIKSTETLYHTDTAARVGIGLVFEYIKPGTAMLNNLLSSDVITTAHVMKNNNNNINNNNAQVESPVVVLGIEEINCEEDDETQKLVSCDTCNVYLGGSKCQSCQLIECGESGSNIIAPIMNCTNVQPVSVETIV